MRLLDDAVDEAEKPPARGRRSGTNDRSLLRDERAVEGLPIRIVIAIIVGVAALGFMMALLGNVNPGPGQTELEAHVQEDSEVLYTGSGGLGDGQVTLNVDIISEDGEPVQDGRVMLEAGTAQLSQPIEAELSGSNTASFDVDPDAVELRADQNSGTLSMTIFPPSDSDYVDALENSEIIVIKGDEP